MGANASGKTSIGKLLVAIFNFINRKEIIKISQHIRDKDKKASFLIDFVLEEKTLYRVTCEIENKNVALDVYMSKILKEDTYEKCVEKFEKIGVSELENDSNNYVTKLKIIPSFGWLFTFPGDAESNCGLIKDDIGVTGYENIKVCIKDIRYLYC